MGKEKRRKKSEVGFEPKAWVPDLFLLSLPIAFLSFGSKSLSSLLSRSLGSPLLFQPWWHLSPFSSATCVHWVKFSAARATGAQLISLCGASATWTHLMGKMHGQTKPPRCHHRLLPATCGSGESSHPGHHSSRCC